jgi:hypothetical protein
LFIFEEIDGWEKLFGKELFSKLVFFSSKQNFSNLLTFTLSSLSLLSLSSNLILIGDSRIFPIEEEQLIWKNGGIL